MSFRRDFKPLFSIRVVDHDSSESISGVVIETTGQCRKQLKNHHLVEKKRDYGLQVYYSTNPWASSPLLGAINSRARLDFRLRFPIDFYQRYLPDIDGGKKLHLYNLEANGAIKVGSNITLGTGASTSVNDAVELVPQRFELEITIPPGAVSLQLRQQFDATVIDTFKLTELGQGDRPEIDLEGRESGRYRLAPDNTPAQNTNLFVEDEVAGQSCQALVSIYLETPQTLAPPAGYQFNARFDSR